MSGGTPVSSVHVRQRCSQEYASSGDDLEDNACSRLSGSSSSLPTVRRANTWGELLENVLWLVSAAFIFYYGDQHVNFLRVLWSDSRINRKALRLGVIGIFLDMGLIFYTILQAMNSRKFYDRSVALRTNAPSVILVGFFSFCLLSYALWPIWGFLTIPLLFTLLMASLLLLPYLLIRRLGPPSATPRGD